MTSPREGDERLQELLRWARVDWPEPTIPYVASDADVVEVAGYRPKSALVKRGTAKRLGLRRRCEIICADYLEAFGSIHHRSACKGRGCCVHSPNGAWTSSQREIFEEAA